MSVLGPLPGTYVGSLTPRLASLELVFLLPPPPQPASMPPPATAAVAAAAPDRNRLRSMVGRSVMSGLPEGGEGSVLMGDACRRWWFGQPFTAPTSTPLVKWRW